MNINESKQTLVNSGFPEVIASIFYEIFPKNTVLLAKWFKQYSVISKENEKDWWRNKFRSFFSSKQLDLYGLTKLYQAGKKSQKDYNEVREELGLWIDPDEEIYPNQPVEAKTLKELREAIKKKLLKDIFFRSTLIEDIMSGKITDLKPYQDLSFQEAKDRYDTLRIFDQKQIVKSYKNGWKWIDVGARCQLVGSMMKNCGSAGVMSFDSDKTILTLFDKDNKPHVMVTYSPNEGRISGDEGVASSAVKDKYHNHVLDLAKHLGVRFDAEKTKSKALKIKAILGNKLSNIKEITPKDAITSYFLLTLNDGSQYYSDSYKAIPASAIENEQRKSGVKTIDAVRKVFRDFNYIGSMKDLPPGSFPIAESKIKFSQTLFWEAITSGDREAIKNVSPNTILTVYHGTPLFRLPQLINGFDSTAIISRDYGGPKHRGLFVTPDFELAKGFGGGAIIEIKVPAKYIHGTDWSGVTGRDLEKEKGKSAVEWAKAHFPNSFRPYMSYTMLATGEPQGLLIGLVKPNQITRMWINERSKGWVEWDRKDYLKSKHYYNTRRVLDKTEYDYFFDTEIDMANPNLSLEDFTKALAKFENREGHEENYVNYFKRLATRDSEGLKERLADIEIGGSRLGRLALENIYKQIMNLVTEKKDPSESVFIGKEGLIIETMKHSRSLLKEGKIFNTNRFRKLAGIITEAAEPNELESAKLVLKVWLNKGGWNKIANHIEKNVEEFYESGEHISGDREGYYSVEPSPDELANPNELLDVFLPEIAEIAPEELKEKILDFDLSEEVYESLSTVIADGVEKMFNDIVRSAAASAPPPRRPRGGWSGEDR